MYRERMARLLDQTGLTGLVLRARSVLPQPYLAALTYHRVAWPEEALGFDVGVVDATPETFERHVEMIARHFVSVGVDDLIGYFGGGGLPNNAVVISFD